MSTMVSKGWQAKSSVTDVTEIFVVEAAIVATLASGDDPDGLHIIHLPAAAIGVHVGRLDAGHSDPRQLEEHGGILRSQCLARQSEHLVLETRLTGGILCAAELTSLLIRKRRLGDGAPGVGGAFQQRAPVSIGIVGRRLEIRAPGVQLARAISHRARIARSWPVPLPAYARDRHGRSRSCSREHSVGWRGMSSRAHPDHRPAPPVRCCSGRRANHRHRDNPTRSPADPCRTSMSSRRHRWWWCAWFRVDSRPGMAPESRRPGRSNRVDHLRASTRRPVRRLLRRWPQEPWARVACSAQYRATRARCDQFISPSSRLAARKNKVVNVAGRYEIELDVTSSAPVLSSVRRFLASVSEHVWNDSRVSVAVARVLPQPGRARRRGKARLFPAESPWLPSRP